MTPRAGERGNIPARVTASELADALGRDIAEVTAVLRSRGEPDSPDDYLGPLVAQAVAEALDARVVIEGRDMALEALYEHEVRGELLAKPGGRAEWLAQGVIDGLEGLDALIEEASEHWSVARMPLIDRNILRLALFELQSDPGTPAAVIISEAVRLAQTYSTEKSASFVNGVLATLATRVRD